MEMWVRGPFDYLHYYLSQGLLERIAFDTGVSTAFCLQEAFFVEDLVVAQMTKNILTPVSKESRSIGLRSTILRWYALIRYRRIAARQSSQPDQGAGWKRGKGSEPRRCCARILREIPVKELASACSLSGSHFARCFRTSFGASVHQHLIQLRIEQAKDLLSGTSKSLVEVASLSGFCDQAAFTRSFSRLEHITPHIGGAPRATGEPLRKNNEQSSFAE